MRFLFFDEILGYEPGRRALGRKTFAFDGAYLADHFPLRPVVPTTLVMESFAQVAGWLNFMLHDRAVRMVVALVESASLERPVQVGETLLLDVEVRYRHPDGATMSGVARSGDEVVGRVERLVFANQPVGPAGFSPRELEHFDYIIAASPALEGHRG